MSDKVTKPGQNKDLGRLTYAEFCMWMGAAIHKSEGFYFRHDSKKNP